MVEEVCSVDNNWARLRNDDMTKAKNHLGAPAAIVAPPKTNKLYAAPFSHMYMAISGLEYVDSPSPSSLLFFSFIVKVADRRARHIHECPTAQLPARNETRHPLIPISNSGQEHAGSAFALGPYHRPK